MAKTSFLDIPDETQEAYDSELKSGERFVIPKITPKTTLISKEKKAILESRSYLAQVVALWDGFTDEVRASWKSVDPHAQQHGFRTFLADQSQRIKLGLVGTATPNEHHQDMVGQILIEAPAEEIELKQEHLATYIVAQRVAGKKGMFEPVAVSEDFALPLQINISFKSDLVSTGEGSYARFYATVRHFYQGQNLSTDEIIEIPLQSQWTSEQATVSSLIGLTSSYNLFIKLHKVTGTLLVDNIKAIHSGSNWARDSFCKRIEQAFTRGFSEVADNWTEIILPTGATYQSIYGADAIYTGSIYGLKWHGVNYYGTEE